MKMAFRIFLIALGVFLIADTLFVMTRSSMNLGVIMPGIIGLPLLILGIFYAPITGFFGSCFFGGLIKWGMIVCYGAFCLLFAFTTCLICIDAGKVADDNVDVLIVLGAGLRGDRVTKILAYRLDAAAKYASENPNTLIIVSGGEGDGEKISEATAMKRALVGAGIDASRIIEEDASESTEENFIFSKRIIDEKFKGGASVAFVTNSFHVFRARLVAQKCGVDAGSVAAKNLWYISLNDHMRECAAITQYFLTGKL